MYSESLVLAAALIQLLAQFYIFLMPAEWPPGQCETRRVMLLPRAGPRVHPQFPLAVVRHRFDKLNAAQIAVPELQCIELHAEQFE